MDLRWFLVAVSTQIKDTQLFSWKFDESFKGKQMIVCIHTYVYVYIYMYIGSPSALFLFATFPLSNFPEKRSVHQFNVHVFSPKEIQAANLENQLSG